MIQPAVRENCLFCTRKMQFCRHASKETTERSVYAILICQQFFSSLSLFFFFIFHSALVTFINNQESSFTKLLRKTERNRPIGLWYESSHDARAAHESKKIH